MNATASIVVTLDIGGSAAKASAFDVASGIPVASAAVPYPARPAAADQGQFEPEEWWLAAVGALSELRGRVGEPAGRYLGITVSAIRIPFVLLDGRGEVVMPGLLNSDRRAAGELGGIAAACGPDEIYQLTGHWLAPEFGLPKLLWTRSNYPAAWQATRTVLQLHDWFIYKLSGAVASERSASGMSQLLDVAGRRWADGLLAVLGVPVSLLPELRAAGTRAGGLLPAVGAATGFAPGTPVHVGGGDTHLSAEAAGASERAVPVVVAGTTAPMQVAVTGLDFAGMAGALYPLLVSEHLTAGRWALETNAGQTGGIVRRLDGLAGQSPAAEAVAGVPATGEPVTAGSLAGEPFAGRSLAGESLADELRRRGLMVRGGTETELTVLAGNPFFGPEGWAASPPATVIGLSPRHRGADVVQACLRATCYAIGSILASMVEHSGISAPYIVATGGMSRNPQWTQLLADVTGREVRVRPLDQIAGRAGAALVAGQGLPGFPASEDVFAPCADDAAAHAAGLALYQELYRTAQLEAHGSRTVTG
jgi:xylulokinase